MSTEERDTESALCVTCGEFKPREEFAEGDCTCMECNDAGRGSVNYAVENGEVVEA